MPTERSDFRVLRILALVLLAAALSRPPVSYHTGTVVSVDAETRRVLIDRDPVESGGPVTRIAYVYTGRRDPTEIRKQQRVGIAARAMDSGFELSGVWPLPEPRRRDAVPPGEEEFGHHHNPHHGGFVGMVGDYHVEAVASRDGLVRAYVSDFSRRPLPLRGFFGKAIMHEGDVQTVRALGRMSTHTGPALGGRFDPFEADEVIIEFDLVHGDRTINIEFLLPLERDVARKPVMPKRCELIQRADYYAVSKPWCALDFGRPIAALELAPGGDVVTVGLEDRSVRFATDSGRLLDESPAAAQATGRSTEGAAAIAVHPADGRIARADGEGRVVVSDAGSSTTMSTPLANVAAMTFAGEYLAAASKDGVVRVWHATTGGQVGERGNLPSQLAITADPSGRRVIAGDSKGTLRLFTVPALRPGVQMEFHRGAVSALAWEGEAIASADDKGGVAVWRFAPPQP